MLVRGCGVGADEFFEDVHVVVENAGFNDPGFFRGMVFDDGSEGVEKVVFLVDVPMVVFPEVL